MRLPHRQKDWACKWYFLVIISLEYLDAPFFNNLVLESDTEGANVDSHDLTDEGILKRLKTDNSSYYQTNNLKSVIPSSCQLNYETTGMSDKSKKTGKKSLGRRGSLPRDTKNSKKIEISKRPCKSRNKNNEFTRVLSERILETTGKSRLNGTRSKVAKLNLYPSMIESKMINQFAHMKNSPSRHHKRTRNNSEFRSMNSNETRNKTAKTCKTQKKLITSLKNWEPEISDSNATTRLSSISEFVLLKFRGKSVKHEV